MARIYILACRWCRADQCARGGGPVARYRYRQTLWPVELKGKQMPKRGQLTLAEFEPVLLKHEREYGNEPNIDLFEVVVAADISDATLFDAVRHFQVADRLMQF